MPSTFSQNLRIELIGAGEQSGTWNVPTNRNLGTLIEQAISGTTNITLAGSDVTLTALNGVADQARSAVLNVTGTPGATRTITIPNVSKLYTVKNRSDSTVDIKTASGTAFSIPTLAEAYIHCDGNNGVTGRVITDAANAFTSDENPLNNTALTGVPTAPTAAAGTNSTQLATTAFVNSALPVGSIIMWFGTLVNVPTGWQICDGTNGTPDLQNRFVVGAGYGYSVGDIGGIDGVALTISEIPAHTHSGNTADTDIAHNHSFSATTGAAGSHSHTGSGTTSTINLEHTHSGLTASNNVGHTHSFSGTTGGGGSHTHSGTANTTNLSGDFWVGGSNGGTSGIVSLVANGGRPGLDNNSGFQQLYRINASHSHSLAINGVGDHTHSFSGGTGGQSADHQHSFTTGGMSANAAHSHTFSFTTSTQANHDHSVSGTTGSGGGLHSHSFTTGSTGSGVTHENRPPYLALYYIMRV